MKRKNLFHGNAEYKILIELTLRTPQPWTCPFIFQQINNSNKRRYRVYRLCKIKEYENRG